MIRKLVILFTFHLINAELRDEIGCEFKINNGIKTLLINETWSSDDEPCTKYVCIAGSNDEKHINIVQKTCDTKCADGFEYKILSGECCGLCKRSFCEYNGKAYKSGEIWKNADNCTVNECVNNGDEPFVTSYKKTCPKLRNCPTNEITTRDCCPYCNNRNQKDFIHEEIVITNRDTYQSHPCLRQCVKGQQLTCYYEFVVESFETMSKACYECPSNKNDCFRPHCISADGMKRSILVVNRMMPGPSIEVCLNDTIIVDLRNRLMSEATTIHWHGIHQRDSPYMDGVPAISQCQIQSGQNFRYTFNAENAGTHFWHSHLGMQRGDGVFGPLIVRNPEDLHENLYDFDMSEYVLTTIDWTHLPATSVFTAHHHGRGDNKPSNILINGRGKYFGNMTKVLKDSIPTEFVVNVPESTEFPDPTTVTIDTESLEIEHTTNSYVEETTILREKRALLDPEDYSSMMPFEVFNVLKGNRYRFRHINAGFLNCPIQLSIDNHTLTVIASDGNSIEPVEVTFLVTYAGERWDFIVNANQRVGNYFIRARGLMDCDERFTSSFQLAVLHYHGAKDEDPSEKPSYEINRKGLTLNALNRGSGIDFVTVAEINSIENRTNNIMKVEPDLKFYLSYDFYALDNPLFHVPNLYGFQQAPFGKVFTPQLNHISNRMPPTPAMLSKGLQDSSFCNESSLASQGVNCKETFCECTHVLQIPLKSVVEMILIDEGLTYDANHPFHLHGNFFHVVGMDRLGNNVTVEEVKELDRLGRLKRRFLNSIEKDTVTVPDGGYTIIRFYADNPGMWLLHCHIDFHAELGMSIVLKVGEYSQMAPVPRNFPTCQSDYTSSIDPIEINSSAHISYPVSTLLTICILCFIHVQ